MTTDARKGAALPALPEPVSSVALASWGPKPDYFTAEQMRAYAAEAIAALAPPSGEVSEAIEWQCRMKDAEFGDGPWTNIPRAAYEAHVNDPLWSAAFDYRALTAAGVAPAGEECPESVTFAGMVYPKKPAPRASGYLPDGSGVEWNAYDTAQMEAYARAAYADGWAAARSAAPSGDVGRLAAELRTRADAVVIANATGNEAIQLAEINKLLDCARSTAAALAQGQREAAGCTQYRPGAPCPTPESCRENGCSAVEREAFPDAAPVGAQAGECEAKELLAAIDFAAEFATHGAITRLRRAAAALIAKTENRNV